MLSGSFDKSVVAWSLATGAREAALEGHAGPVRALAVHGGVLLSGADDGFVRVWALGAGWACLRVVQACLPGSGQGIWCLEVRGRHARTPTSPPTSPPPPPPPTHTHIPRNTYRLGLLMPRTRPLRPSAYGAAPAPRRSPRGGASASRRQLWGSGRDRGARREPRKRRADQRARVHALVRRWDDDEDDEGDGAAGRC